MMSLSWNGETARINPEQYNEYEKVFGDNIEIFEENAVIVNKNAYEIGGVIKYFIFTWENIVTDTDVETLKYFNKQKINTSNPMILNTNDGKYKVVFANIGDDRCKFVFSGISDPETGERLYTEGSLTLIAIEKER